MNNSEGRFMVAVGAMVEHVSTGKLLFLKRSPDADFSPGIWENITGRMKQFEEPEQALHREVKEEAGIGITIVKPLNVFYLFRGEKTADNELVGIIYWCQAKSDQVVLSNEHTDFQWVLLEEALKLIDHPDIRKDIEVFMRERTGNG